MHLGGVGQAGAVGDERAEDRAVVRQCHSLDGVAAVRRGRDVRAAALPAESLRKEVGQARREDGGTAFLDRDVDEIRQNERRDFIDEARVGNRSFRRARREPPLHGEMVDEVGFVMEHFHVVTPARLERDREGLLSVVRGVIPRLRARIHPGDKPFGGRVFVGAQQQV